MTNDFSDITGGDTRRGRVLEDNLNQLANGRDPLLREMAKAVLDGELRLRDATQSDTYGSALSEAFVTFWTKYEDMSPEERAELAGLGCQYIERAE